MDKLFIQLSKLGDVLNVLPIAYSAAQRGERVGIMASKEYADVLDGCSYVEKVVFDDKPWEIAKAVESAQKLCKTVVVTQVNGPVKAIEKYAYEPAGQKHAVTDSFCRESYKLAGCLKDWGKVPLVFDKRDKAREDALMPKGWFNKGKKKKIMLVSAGSASSPFRYRDLLLELLRLKYPNFNIIDLSTIQAERFYDLLGLYEAAYCLVTVDTSHLHLASAVPSLPVMALIQDNPIYWYGSAWRPSHKFHCRYRDFPSRALELFTAIDNLMKPNPTGLPMVITYGKISETQSWYQEFVVQYGACRRDAVNVLDDKEHFPMLQDVIRMAMQVVQSKIICLTRQDVIFSDALKSAEGGVPCYAYRMNRDKNGNDTFFPTVDLFAAPVEFWVKVFPEIPDLVMGADSYWALLLMQIFKKHGAVEIEGIYRNEI